jgi:hypothetical protein
MTNKKGHKCQFSVILSFPVLVIKSQVQSFDHAGIYQLKAVFGYWHLIVVLTGRRIHWNVKFARDIH